MAVATGLPLIGFPNFNGDVLGGTLDGLAVEAAVGAALFLSGVDGPGVDQCASLDVYTSLITWPKLIVDSRNLDTHSLRSSTSLDWSHCMRCDMGNPATLRLARK